MIHRNKIFIIFLIFDFCIACAFIIYFVKFRNDGGKTYNQPEVAVMGIIEHDGQIPEPVRKLKMHFSKPSGQIATTVRSEGAIANVRPRLEEKLKNFGLQWAVPVYIYLEKDEKKLHLDVFDQNKGYFVPFKTYPILKMSGTLGPKTKEGDRQCPEGFYYITTQSLNPASKFHLSFDIGYPNNYDRQKGHTGSYIMVHGSDKSIGCFAMGDAAIEEIYAMITAGLSSSQKIVRIHCYPFTMTDENLSKHSDSNYLPFWKNLMQGYDFYQQTRLAPNVEVVDGVFFFNDKW
ncbi:MAG: murein L,D-transpeptidase [Phycisphaerae bacterium]|nr:murein L,D-transpeptidase [Phycisphaerae bacterium]